MVIISNGNSKLGKIPNVSLPPIKSCIKGIPCNKDCYALKSYRMYPNVKKAWDNNWKAYKLNQDTYFKNISNYLDNHHPMFFRWQVSGEIQDQIYLKNMISIANNHSGTMFLCFTKQYGLNYSVIPDNLSIVLSAWPGFTLVNNYSLPIAYMQDGSEDRIENAIECPGNCESCGMCFQLLKIGKNVVFYKH